MVTALNHDDGHSHVCGGPVLQDRGAGSFDTRGAPGDRSGVASSKRSSNYFTTSSVLRIASETSVVIDDEQATAHLLAPESPAAVSLQAPLTEPLESLGGEHEDVAVV
jgi:hypothetical protein